MARKTRQQPPDPYVAEILAALAAYDAIHPQAEIEVYRQNSASVRIRIIDPDFQGLRRVDREDRVWEILNQLSEDAQAEISFVLLLTPGETKNSFANAEFENPIPSML